MNVIPIKKKEILLAEDDVADIEMMRNLLEVNQLSVEVSVVRNGLELTEDLEKRKQDQSPQPNLIILDLNMPKKNGRQALKEIKVDNDFKKIPVIVMSSSDDRNDIEDSYAHHANCYIRKPMDLKEMRSVTEEIKRFWFSTVTLPT